MSCLTDSFPDQSESRSWLKKKPPKNRKLMNCINVVIGPERLRIPEFGVLSHESLGSDSRIIFSAEKLTKAF